MKVLAVKVNTTGFNLSKDKIFDIGCVLYDVDSRCPISIFSTFIPVDIPIASCNNSNSLSLNDLEMFSELSTKEIVTKVNLMFLDCDCVLSCNGREFDRSFLNRYISNNGSIMPRKTWIDLRYDVDYPDTCVNRGLMYLEAFHNFVNPFRGRCVFDCMSMLKIGQEYGFNTLLFNARSPIVTLSVDGSTIDIMENKTKLHEKGFYWSDEHRKFTHSIKEAFLTDSYLNSLGFGVQLENVEDIINEK